LVVDLGSGTGLSTLVWAGRADAVVGIEPNDDMREVAEGHARTMDTDVVRFVKATTSATGLMDGSADVVTVSQALHWMEPQSTFAEVARILRPGGVFAAYDYDWPPLVDWELDEAFHTFQRWVNQRADIEWVNARADIPLAERLKPMAWTKTQHLERMHESSHFLYTREIALHSIEEGDAERFIGLSLTVAADIYLHHGLIRPDEPEIIAFQAAVRTCYPAPTAPWFLSYHARLGIK
jgi:SAM-dependent methyltransferase